MVAAANSGQTLTVSRQTQSVEGSGGAKQAGGAKKSALGVFAKLLAGLTRKIGAGGEGAGEVGTEGAAGTGKTARGLKNASATKAASPGAEISVPGSEKIRHRDRRFLAALQGEGENPASEAADGPVKKSKKAQKNSGRDAPEQPALALSRDAPLREGLKGGEAGSGDRLAAAGGAENRAPEAAEAAFRGRRGEGPGKGAEGAVEAGTEAGAKAPPGLASGAAAPASRGERETAGEEPGITKKDRAAKNSRKNRERFALEVRDLRTEGGSPGLNAPQKLPSGLEAGAERTADLAVDLRREGQNQELAQPGRVKTAGEAFEDILSRELHQNLNGDIVRQASILVKDGGEGTIRLSLKPESLGMVKVRLEMAENKITGRIIVESNEALRAFEREIHSLEQAFRDSGFAGASLEMALAGEGGQSGPRQGNDDPAQALFSPRAVSSNYDAMGETMDLLAVEAGFDGFAGPGASRVNVLA